MSEFDSIVIGGSAVPALAATVLLMVAIPVVFFLFWRIRHREDTKLGWLLAGALGFIISARVLELGLHYFCILADNPVSRFINGNAVAFVLYGTAAAGIFEECGRHIVIKHILKKDRTRENAVLYGIGHGGIEILAVLLPSMITYLAVAVLFSSGDRAEALRALNITEETAAAALPAVRAAASFDWGMAAMNVLERVFAMLLHIGLTVIVWYGVTAEKRWPLPLAIGLHMLMDTFPALYQRGLVPLWSVEVWGAFWTAAVLLIAAKLYRKPLSPEAEHAQ